MKCYYYHYFCLIFTIILCAFLVACSHGYKNRPEEASETLAQEPVQVYLMGQECSFSNGADEEWSEYSFPVTLGLETTWYMPGYAQGNPLYQALLEYEEETGIEIEVTFFATGSEMMRQIREQRQQGNAPDLALVLRKMEDAQGNSWRQWQEEDFFTDMAPYLNIGEEQYYMPVISSGQYKEAQYLIPLLFNINGYITSEEFLKQAGQKVPPHSTSYEELLHLFQETCIALQGNTDKVALYEGTIPWEYYILHVFNAAASYQNLETVNEISKETIMQMLEVMREFLKQNFQTIPDYEQKTYAENVNAVNALYDRFNFGPMYREDPEYKRNMLGIMIDGGYGGSIISSSFIMQVYALQTYYHDMGEHLVMGGIPMENMAGRYAACVNVLGFCPTGADNYEGAGQVLQYLLEYTFPPEVGISVNKSIVETQLQALTQTETELYIQPRYSPLATEEQAQEIFNQSKVWFEPLDLLLADQLLDILNHIEGASLLYQAPMDVLGQGLEDYYNGNMNVEEAASWIRKEWTAYAEKT